MYKKRTGFLGIIITIIILVLLVILTNINITKLTHIESAFSNIVMPFQTGITYLKNKISGNNVFFADMDRLKEGNKNLEKKNSELEKSLRELEIIKAENSTLKEYLNLTEKYSNYTTMPAYIINKDISNFSNIIVINVGSKDGIEPNMTVIADKGLVGHIISVTDHTAKVQTIIDSSNTISASISTSKDSVICRGNIDNGNLRATYIPTTANLIQGDSIETSGLGGIYPKGIYIGTIDKIVNKKNITDRYAEIKPAVDFEKLNAVLVITN